MRPAPHEGRAPGAGAGGHRHTLRSATLLAAVLAAAALLLVPHLGDVPIERAEIYFVDAARAMVESGDWLVPRYRGTPFYDKPALAYWLMASAFAWAGPSMAAARFVSVAAALGLIVATYALGARVGGRPAALRSAIVLATTLLVLAFARVAMSDMLLALWCTAAVALAAHAGGRHGNAALALAGLALGLGFLTKGPVAVLFGGMGVALVLLAARRRGEPLPRPAAFALAAVLAAAAAVPWFVALYARVGPEPLRWFFLRENLQRFAGETYDAGRPAAYYLGVYLALGLPWSVAFPRAAWTAPPAARPLLFWAGLMLVPLSLSRGKIDYYLLPLAPAVSVVVACWLAAREWKPADRVFARAALAVTAAGSLAVLAAARRVPAGWGPGAAGEVALGLVVAACVAAAVLAALRARPRAVTAVLAGSSAALYAVLVNAHVPAFRAAQPNAAIRADVDRERLFRPDATLAFCRDAPRAHRDVLFEARHAAEERCDLWALAASDQPRLLLLTPDERAALATVPTLRDVAEYQALPATVLTLRGLVEGVAPERLVLAANYATADPVAEAKRKKDRKRALQEGAAGVAPASAGPPGRGSRLDILAWDGPGRTGTLTIAAGSSSCSIRFAGRDGQHPCRLEVPEGVTVLTLQHGTRRQSIRMLDVGTVLAPLRDETRPLPVRVRKALSAHEELRRRYPVLAGATDPLSVGPRETETALAAAEKRLGYPLPRGWRNTLLRVGRLRIEDSASTPASDLDTSFEAMVRQWETPRRDLDRALTPAVASLFRRTTLLFTEVGDGYGGLLYEPDSVPCAGGAAFYWMHQDDINDPSLMKGAGGGCASEGEVLAWLIGSQVLLGYDDPRPDAALVDRSAPGPFRMFLEGGGDGEPWRLRVRDDAFLPGVVPPAVSAAGS